MDSSEAALLSSLQAVSQNWAVFDWEGKTKQWETVLNQTKEARDQSLVARKQLADTTKQFKKSVKSVEQVGSSLGEDASQENAAATVKAIEALAKHCRVTVKAYQEEIDNLTRRCKASETAYSALAQSLGELPDPAAVVATATEHVHGQHDQVKNLQNAVEDLQKQKAALERKLSQQAQASTESAGLSRGEHEELLQLRKEVAEYKVEFRSLKNQDITIRKLEAKIVELQQGGEEAYQEQLEKAKEELAETEGRRTAEALEREAVMERKVQTLELQLKAERAGRAATQAHLLETHEGAGEREAAWEAQRSILVDDAERLRVDLHQATRERDDLRLKVAALEGSASRSAAAAPASGGITMADLLAERKAYEAEVSELSHTVNTLREEAVTKDNALHEERKLLQAKLDSAERERQSLQANLASLESQLAGAPSQALVESMKRELRILKRLEYNADDADFSDMRDPEMTGGNEDPEKDLESVLVAKLRRVEAELVKERNQRVDTKELLRDLEEKLEELTKEKAEADKMIASLEQDLDKAISSSTPISPPPKSLPEPTISQSNPATLQSVLDPDSVPPSPMPPIAPQTPNASASAAEKAADDHSVATIIMAQRDRLRARCEALEAERDSFKRELQIQVDAAESLKTDNTKLFEKMRYLQSFNRGGSSGPRAATFNRAPSRDLDLEALEQRYEASVDPFRQFSKAERQRKLNEMSPMERTVFLVAKAFLGTKEMRTFLFFYVCAMHFLVFATTYHWSHNDSSCDFMDHEHLTHLPPAVGKSPEEIVKALSNAGP